MARPRGCLSCVLVVFVMTGSALWRPLDYALTGLMTMGLAGFLLAGAVRAVVGQVASWRETTRTIERE